MSPVRNPESDFSLDSNQSATAQPARRKTNVMRVALGEDGKVDTSRITPENLEKMRQSLGVEVSPPEAEKSTVPINRTFIPHIYSLLEVIIRRAGRMFLKWPPELADEMHFSPEKKEALTEPTAVVLERYAPAWLIENQDIAALGAALTDAVDDMVSKGTQEWATKYPDQAAAMLANMGIIVETEHGSNGVEKHSTTIA